MAAKRTAKKRASKLPNREPQPKYGRIVLKLSGESLQGPQGFGIHGETIQAIAKELKEVHALGVEIAVVVGGGNIFRGGRQRAGSTAPPATTWACSPPSSTPSPCRMPSKRGVHTRVQSAIAMNQIAEPFIRRRAIRHLEKGRVVIFAAGTGNPYFSTDTAAALRATEINADVILKATKVDGIYDTDPERGPTPNSSPQITYLEVLHQHLKVMDSTAISLCMDNNMPIVVFNMDRRATSKGSYWASASAQRFPRRSSRVGCTTTHQIVVRGIR